jgi:peptidoglycan/LPS O-acetylase OafA/YrhL
MEASAVLPAQTLPRVQPEALAAERIPALDAIRGIAILLVMMRHFLAEPAVAHLPPLLAELIGFGWSGVDLFFVLSGFLITGNLLRHRGSAHYYRNFYARRTLRIFPLYYAVLCFVFLVVARFSWFEPERVRYAVEHQLWLWLYATNLLIVKNSGYILASINHFWSLAIEEHFYLVWPAVVAGFSGRSLRRVILLVIGAAFLIRCACLVVAPTSPAAYVLTPCRMDSLAFGAMLACLVRDVGLQQVARYARPLGGACALVIASIGIWRGTLAPADHMMLSIGVTIIALGYSAAIVSAVAAPPSSLLGRLVSLRVLRFFGKYAYGLYVFHFPLHILFKRWLPFERLRELLGSAELAMLAHSASVGAASVLAALLSWHLYEKHFLTLKRYFAAPAGTNHAERWEHTPGRAAFLDQPGAALDSACASRASSESVRSSEKCSR